MSNIAKVSAMLDERHRQNVAAVQARLDALPAGTLHDAHAALMQQISDVDTMSKLLDVIETGNGPTVYVTYAVPVQVRVNLATAAVERVVTIDEEVSTDMQVRKHVVDADSDEPVNEATERLAYLMADNTEWPGWEAGF